MLKRRKNAKKRRPGWFGGLCVTAPAGGQGKKHTEEPVKRETERAGIKIASPFTTSLQVCKNWNQNSELPECVTMSSEIEVGNLILVIRVARKKLKLKQIKSTNT